MRLADFDYDLPEELIAQEPLKNRDESRLMVLHRESGIIEHKHFKDIVHYLKAGDVLVLNNTRVVPARLVGIKEGTGARIEVLLLKPVGEDNWETLVKPGRRVLKGTRLIFGQGQLTGQVIDITDYGGRVIKFNCSKAFEEILNQLGLTPLPPYIKKPLAEPERYQTVYAKKMGSVAAPTAGLHFTIGLLKEIQARGVRVVEILLHVGLGTFRPVEVEDIRQHHMHAEYYEINCQAVDLINTARKQGGRVIAVGTTTVRCLESAADKEGFVQPALGWTGLFIYPGYRFKVIDALLTNFHLPKSTLLMMVCALAGKEKIMAAYSQAIASRYRFYSFGDAMLII